MNSFEHISVFVNQIIKQFKETFIILLGLQIIFCIWDFAEYFNRLCFKEQRFYFFLKLIDQFNHEFLLHILLNILIGCWILLGARRLPAVQSTEGNLFVQATEGKPLCNQTVCLVLFNSGQLCDFIDSCLFDIFFNFGRFKFTVIVDHRIFFLFKKFNKLLSSSFFYFFKCSELDL